MSFSRGWFSSLAVDSYDSVYVSGYELEGDGGDAILNFLESNQELTVYYAPGPRITYIDPKMNTSVCTSSSHASE